MRKATDPESIRDGRAAENDRLAARLFCFRNLELEKNWSCPRKQASRNVVKKNGFTLGHNYMKRRFVILNEVKNLIGSMSSVGEILRLHLRMTLRHSLWAGIDMSFAHKGLMKMDYLSLRLVRIPYSERCRTSLPASGGATGDQGRHDSVKAIFGSMTI